MLHLQRLETTLSVCAEEPDHSQLFTHLGRMALEFNRLASKVHKNEQRTSILQVRKAREGCQGLVSVLLLCLPTLQLFLGSRGTSRTSEGYFRQTLGFLFTVVNEVRKLWEGMKKRKEMGKSRWALQISWLG
jgi:hypothetical protein